mgnify:CR=1 FL=1
MTTIAKENTKEALIEAATEIFAEKGYEDATLREICAKAGANNAAINYHFRSKRDLYNETLKQACSGRSICDELDGYADATPVERLKQFIQALVERVFDKSKTAIHTRLMLREMAQPTDATEELVRDLIRPDFDYLMEILDEILPGSESAQQKHLIIFSIIGQCVYYKIATPVVTLLVSKKEFRSYNASLLTDHITRFTLAALGVEPLLS